MRIQLDLAISRVYFPLDPPSDLDNEHHEGRHLGEAHQSENHHTPLGNTYPFNGWENKRLRNGPGQKWCTTIAAEKEAN